MEMSGGGGGGIHALCDDALAEILVRLPSESVLRCRAVCKSWRRIATGRSFLEAHAARSPREMIILQSWNVSAVPLYPGLDAADEGARRRYLCNPTRYDGDGKWAGWSRLVASLDGLLVLQQRPGLYVVCNPTTRQWTNLPVLAPRPCAAAFHCGAFYHHRPSGEYRLLCHAEEHSEPGSSDWKDYYYILSAGSSLPRRLGRAPADRPYKKILYGFPVAHRGTLYWIHLHPEARRTGKMLAFRTDSETFRLVSRPPTGDAPPASALLELDGALCALAKRDGMLLDVWVLQDYDAGRWTLRHRVAVPPPRFSDDRRFLVSWAMSAGGSTIIVGGGLSSVIRLCDLQEKRVKEVQFDSTPSLLMFTESLVSHDFFQAPRCPELAPLKFPD